jgi:hypothetical protein
MVIRAEGLLVERCESELIVFAPGSNEAHSLNETASRVFELCDGVTTRGQIVEALAVAGLPADEAVVDLALADLSEASLVIDDAGPDTSLTRRLVIRKLGLSATAAAMLPIVETIFVQPAAAQTSPPLTTSTTTITTTATPTSTTQGTV